MEPRNATPDEILDGGKGTRLGWIEGPPRPVGPRHAVPLAVIQGPRPGPTVWINAALHGDEYLGPATLIRLLRDLDPRSVRGRIVMTPTLNPEALLAMQRFPPGGSTDFNRIWRTDLVTPEAGDLAAWAKEVFLGRSDAVLDLHSGGNRFLQQSYTICCHTGGPSDAAALGLAKACGLPWVWSHRDSILRDSLIAEVARAGKPAVLIEVAGEGKAERSWIAEMASAVRGALARLGLLEGSPRYLPSYRVFEGYLVVRNREEGLWSRAAEPGAAVAGGEPLGHVLDLLGREREVLTSPRDAAVAGICTYGFVPREEYIAELAHTFHEEGPPA